MNQDTIIPPVGQAPARLISDGVAPPIVIADPSLFVPTPLQRFKELLRDLGRPYRDCGSGFDTSCPLRSDARPSLTFGEGKDKRLLLYCHQCEAEYKDILAAYGLTPWDMHPRNYDGLCGGEESLASLAARIGQPDEQVLPEISQYEVDDWDNYASIFIHIGVETGKRGELATLLGVSELALQRLWVGWCDWEHMGRCWSYPERDTEGRIIGIQRRFEGSCELCAQDGTGRNH